MSRDRPKEMSLIDIFETSASEIGLFRHANLPKPAPLRL